jgi:alpha-1,6-mannosyltransferase
VTLRSSALLGAAGAVLLALGSDLPGSPYGPHAGGLWPFAGTGPAPGWEGPKVPSWASVADQGPGVPPGRLLATVAVVVGVGLLALAWVGLWRRLRRHPDSGVHRLWWVVAAWVAPLLFAAPFASQDVWTYGAEGKMVLDGFGGYSSGPLLGHSIWTAGVDAKWLAHPAPYGPGELDLSAFFVKISGGRPWVAAECWRVMAIVGLLLCAWGLARIVAGAGGDGRTATLAAVANPAILIVLVAGIHNDALMLGLTVAALAVALSGRRTWGLLLCALAVAVKPNALLVVGALAWWTWGSRWRDRTKGAVLAAAVLVAVLVVSGIGVGGGFGWLKADIFSGGADGVWSLGAQLSGAQTGWPITAFEMAGAAIALAFVLGARWPRSWIVGLGWGFAALAVTVPRAEPWYLTWAVVLIACGGLQRRSERIGLVILVAMMAGSILPLGILWWFEGVIALLWLGVVSARTHLRSPPPSPSPSSGPEPSTDAGGDDQTTGGALTAAAPVSATAHRL